MAGLILNAMEAVANGTKYPEFKGNVAAVYTHPLENTPGSSGGHYVRCACTQRHSTCSVSFVFGYPSALVALAQGDDALTYMNVGEAMGKAMAALLKD